MLHAPALEIPLWEDLDIETCGSEDRTGNHDMVDKIRAGAHTL